MPPAPYLFEGLAAIRQLVDRARDTGTWRLLPTWANRQPAAACYLLDPASGEFRAFKLDVLGLAEGKIAEITAFGRGISRPSTWWRCCRDQPRHPAGSDPPGHHGADRACPRTRPIDHL